MLELAIEQLTGEMQVFVQYWAGGEMRSGSVGEVMHVGVDLSTMERYLCGLPVI